MIIPLPFLLFFFFLFLCLSLSLSLSLSFFPAPAPTPLFFSIFQQRTCGLRENIVIAIILTRFPGNGPATQAKTGLKMVGEDESKVRYSRSTVQKNGYASTSTTTSTSMLVTSVEGTPKAKTEETMVEIENARNMFQHEHSSSTPTRLVFLRILLLIMFMLLAALLGYFVYKITYNSQLSEFQSTYNAAVAQLITDLQVCI